MITRKDAVRIADDYDNRLATFAGEKIKLIDEKIKSYANHGLRELNFSLTSDLYYFKNPDREKVIATLIKIITDGGFDVTHEDNSLSLKISWE